MSSNLIPKPSPFMEFVSKQYWIPVMMVASALVGYIWAYYR